ncbi:MAG: hypothetical protein R6V00_12885 [Candidatus Aminicenantes bacterium]
MGFVTRSIPQRGISLPFGLRSPLKRNHARSALKGMTHPMPFPFVVISNLEYPRITFMHQKAKSSKPLYPHLNLPAKDI